MSETMGSYRIEAFQAVEHPEYCTKFFDGHAAVLTGLGIKNLNSARPSWMNDPNVYVLIAIDEEEEVVAGLRVHRFNSYSYSLPIIESIKEQDPTILDVIGSTLPDGTAEACGLWSAKKVFGKGLTPLLCIAAIPVMADVGINNFYCFAAPYTEKMIKTNGLVEVTEIGNEGRLPYPTPEFISVVLKNPDIHSMEYADEFNRERVFQLMKDPVTTLIEDSPRGNIEVHYNLRLKKGQEILVH
ncbi:MAG: hypothetical protein ACKO7B_16115 [Flavobacteriales bacterium]